MDKLDKKLVKNRVFALYNKKGRIITIYQGL